MMTSTTFYINENVKGIRIDRKEYDHLFKKFPGAFTLARTAVDGNIYVLTESKIEEALTALAEKNEKKCFDEEWETLSDKITKLLTNI